MTLDDLDWYPPESDLVPVDPKPCRHFRNRRIPTDGGWTCGDCGKVTEKSAVRRGRNNRSRGNAIEREVAAKLGLRRVGQYGGPDDASSEWLICQVKSGGYFPERAWTWLQALPATAAQTRAVVITDTPGPGHRRRAVVIVDLEDWAALHGGSR